MSIQKKLMIHALLIIAIFSIMLSFIVYHLKSVQQSNANTVPELMVIQEAQLQVNNMQQQLENYAVLINVPQDEAVVTQMTSTMETTVKKLDKTIGQIEQMPFTGEAKNTVQMLVKRYQLIKEETFAIIPTKDVTATKRLAVRTGGISNDIEHISLYQQDDYYKMLEGLNKRIQNVIWYTIIGTLFIVILAITLTYLATRKITKPLATIANHAVHIADGDLRIEKMTYTNNDELKQLNDAFHSMGESLQQLIQRIQQTGVGVEQHTAQIVKDNTHVKEMSNAITSASSELEQGTHEIKSSVQNTVNLAERMNATFDDTVAMATHNVQRGKDMMQAIEDSQRHIEAQRETMQASMTTSEKMESAFNKLKQQTVEIEEMAQSVSAISDQTQLLALNASIEAARAGESGKGFAVVAEEVGKLAADSTTATTTIFDLVQAIQQQFAIFTTAIEQNQQVNQEQHSATEQAVKAFAFIQHKITSMMQDISQMATDMQHTKMQSEQTVANMEEMSSIIEENAANTTHISQATDEQLEALTQVAKQIIHLQQLTDELMSGVNRFKLK